MDWELTKENCVPVRQGRSKAALQELADPAAEALEVKRRELWAEVTDYKGDDPLEAWLRYIKWMQEYGVGGGKADLLKVLEACTKELQKHSRYINDIRYLRIWIHYADCLPDPGDVFLFLKEKGIGRGFALYYEAYATYFELHGNFQNADAVYTDGIQRGAKPLERLKQKHLGFQQRMAQRIQRRIQDEQLMGPPQPEPVRSSLGTIGLRPGGRSGAHAAQQSSLFGAEGPQQDTLLFGSRQSQQTAQDQRGQRPAVSVLADEEFGAAENRGLRGLPGYNSMPQMNNLRELKPFSVVRKENLDRPTAWNQAVLPTCAGGSATAGGGGGGIEIFTDEEFQDGEADAAGPSSSRPAAGGPAAPGPTAAHPLFMSGLMPAAQGQAAGAAKSMDALMTSLAPPPSLLPGTASARSSLGWQAAPSGSQPSAALGYRDVRPLPLPVAAQLMADTLPHQPASATSLSVAQRAEPGPVPSVAVEMGQQPMPGALQPQAQPDGAAGPAEDDGAETGSEEVCYEELRAALWFRQNPLPLRVASAAAEGSGRASGCGSRPAAVGAGTAALAAEKAAVAALATTQAEAAATSCSDRAAMCAADSRDDGHAAPRRLPLGQVAPMVRPPLQAGAYEEPEATSGRVVLGQVPSALVSISQRGSNAGAAGPAALSALAPIVGTVASRPLAAEPPTAADLQPAESCLLSLGVSGHGAGCQLDEMQPTITISTRSAFDLMNSFFNEDLPHQARRTALAERPAPTAPGVQGLALQGQDLELQSQTQRHPLGAAAAASAQAQAHRRPPAAAAPMAAAAASGSTRGAEPTVTLHTRQAFDALNDMFSDPLPVEEARTQSRRSDSRGSNGGGGDFRKDVCRLANAGRNSSAAASGRPPGACNMGFAVCSSTAPMATSSNLVIHEDTFILGPVGATATSGRRGPLHIVGAPGGPSTSMPGGTTAGIYEDTEFIPRGPPRQGTDARNPSVLPGGALILEDTEFLTRPQPPRLPEVGSGTSGAPRSYGQSGVLATDPLGHGAQQDSNQASSAAAPGPFSVHSEPGVRDRYDACRNRALIQTSGALAPALQNGRSKEPLQIYEDTESF